LLFDAQDEGCVIIWMCHWDCNEFKNT
jgi:hypothetical protein